MLQKQITPANADAEIRLLYETAFPQEEQIPWDDLVRLIDEMHLDFTAYYDNDILIGFTIVYPRPSFNWYWYFAVKEEPADTQPTDRKIQRTVLCSGYGVAPSGMRKQGAATAPPCVLSSQRIP